MYVHEHILCIALKYVWLVYITIIMVKTLDSEIQQLIRNWSRTLLRHLQQLMRSCYTP